MADTTPSAGIRYIFTGQASAFSLWNDGILKAEAALMSTSVKSRTTTAEPGSPAEGDRYAITGAGTSGEFLGHTDELAEYAAVPDSDPATFQWVFVPFFEGMTIWDEGAAGGAEEAQWDGSAWDVTFT